MRRLILLGLILAFAKPLFARADDVAGIPSFTKEVAPLLVSRCVRCHGEKKPKAGLDMRTRDALLKGGESGPALEPGKSAGSLLLKRVQDKEMPPSGKPLSAAEVSVLQRWIDAGADWTGPALKAKADEQKAGPDWWAFQPIKKPSVPSVKNGAWVRSPIDAFVLAALEAKGLHPAPEADRRTYIRRVTLDLTGLLPTPREVEEFVEDQSAKAYEKLVDRLLASPHYGERWGRHWLDVARFAESSGYENNKARLNAWHYRDWVIRSFNEDKPYPRFVQEQLAGDAVSGYGDSLVDAATGFLVAGATDLNVTQVPTARMMQRLNDLDDMITTVSGAFLALTVNCARCHDHKFDPISQKEYYGLQAILNGVYHDERPVRDKPYEERRKEIGKTRRALWDLEAQIDRHDPLAGPRGAPAQRAPISPVRNVERFTRVKARFVRMTITATAKDDQPALDEFEVFSAEASPRNIALSSAGARETASSEAGESFRIKNLNDGLHGEKSTWVSGAPGKGWLMIEFPQEASIDRVVWGRDRTGKSRTKLISEYRVEVSRDGKNWQSVAGSWDRLPAGAATPKLDTPERKASRASILPLEKRLATLTDVPQTYAGSFKLAAPAFLLKGGDPMQPDELVPPSVLAVVPGTFKADATTPEQKRRLALAAWISDEKNPLTDRVMVNRLWHYHFGRGLVGTPNDFGWSGDRPSHPDLLDWLATEFRSQGKRLKPMHRLMVLSSTYRQSSKLDAKAQAMDADGRLLWRFPPHRMEAEVIHDSMLQVSGSLDERIGGPPYLVWTFQPKGVTQYTAKEKPGPETFRRMVYQFAPRNNQDHTFGAFDCPENTVSAPRRAESTTALQSLNLWNSEFVLDQCDRWAERLRKDAGTEPAAQVRLAFALIFGRPPSSREQEGAVRLVGSHGLAVFCRTLYNSNEFLFGP